jgi:hypothetical protein
MMENCDIGLGRQVISLYGPKIKLLLKYTTFVLNLIRSSVDAGNQT